MAEILSIRPIVSRTYAGDGATSTPGAISGISVNVDRNEDGRIIGILELLFSDHAGLEAEWVAGVSTTLLSAAIDDNISSISFPSDTLSVAQKALVGVTYVIA